MNKLIYLPSLVYKYVIICILGIKVGQNVSAKSIIYVP